MPENNDWNQWSRYVLKALEAAEAQRVVMKEEIVKLRLEVQTLKTKSHMWGAVGGAVVSLIITIIAGLIMHLLKKM